MQSAPNSIGRAKTVLVSGDGVHAVTTSVAVRATEADGPPRVCFVGPGAFSDSAAQHITEIVVRLWIASSKAFAFLERISTSHS